MGTERGKHTQKLGFKGGIKENHLKTKYLFQPIDNKTWHDIT